MSLNLKGITIFPSSFFSKHKANLLLEAGNGNTISLLATISKNSCANETPLNSVLAFLPLEPKVNVLFFLSIFKEPKHFLSFGLFLILVSDNFKISDLVFSSTSPVKIVFCLTLSIIRLWAASWSIAFLASVALVIAAVSFSVADL
ncbi:hypothetical protein AMIKIPNL_00202 [Mycoplasmopsis arginini]|nr:hypothetical protein [Mycoplasmopsis arginini]MDI3352089.1 hypothetical protein [Mycoplasmopsis arginini]